MATCHHQSPGRDDQHLTLTNIRSRRWKLPVVITSLAGSVTVQMLLAVVTTPLMSP
jgi:hypothetical protein